VESSNFELPDDRYVSGHIITYPCFILILDQKRRVNFKYDGPLLSLI
jgi:hypothetical protein